MMQNGGDDPNGGQNSTPTYSLAVASLAVHLLMQHNLGSLDEGDLRLAVEKASRLLILASKPIKEHAYEIFRRDTVMGMQDIAAAFKEAQWGGMNAPNTVTKYVRVLLDSLYRDIENRRALLTTALRQRLRGADPLDEAHHASIVIKNLLRDLGMDTVFGRQLDDVVMRFWHDIVEAWLKVDQQLREDLEKTPSVSTALFSAICVDSSYEEYAAAKRPPDDLGTDGLLAVIVWLDGSLSKRLGDGDDNDGLLDTLSKLNHWPESLCPGDRRFSEPFAECVANLARGPEQLKESQVKFNLGVQRFGHMWARLMLAEFSKKCSSEPTTNRLQEIVRNWNEQDPDIKAKNSELILDDPQRVIECLESFLRGEMPLFPTSLPFHGTGIKYPALVPYAKELDALMFGFREVCILARHLPCINDNFQEIVNAIREEKVRITKLATTLADPEDTDTRERVKRGEELVRQSTPPQNPGRINPHLLFRYASERGLLEDLLVRKEGINEAKIPTPDSATGE